ncbi:Mur ligase middle domain containing protein, putative [Angomonas deanei]|uniref:tetrahydrofolate synthase n=2 Tax=Angomonas deanei TaxID=59799 RepID=A0A7G2C4H1_9TRYP|nr:Mur ligase middle domain containing protein, putative [Angomonas deanei]
MRRYLSSTVPSSLSTKFVSRGAFVPTCYPDSRVTWPSMQFNAVRMASTLHKGITKETGSGPLSTHGGDDGTSRLGDNYVVKTGAGRTSSTDAKQDRSFEAVLAALDELTSRPPNRCPDNIAVTKLLLHALHLHPHGVDEEGGSRMQIVHVAGTKGKGTTAAYTAGLLQSYGYKVGLFISPHLVDIRERFLVDNAFLPKETFAQYFFEFKAKHDALLLSERQSVREAVTEKFNYFRFLFLLAVYIFEKESIQVAVFEVGVGGRIDATNAFDTVDVSVITALGMDHTELLGNTIEKIAEEKAGIMKPGVVCYAAPQVDYPKARRVLETVAQERQTALVLLDAAVFPIRHWPSLAIGGEHAVEDSKLALMAARKVANIPPVAPLDEGEKNVLRTLTFAGRSQVIPVDGGKDITYYLDGAHTVESITGAMTWFMAESAARTHDEHCRRAVVFYSSRDPKQILKAFMPFTKDFCKVAMAQIQHPKVQLYASRYQKGQSSLEENAVLQSREALVAVTGRWREMYREVVALPCPEPFQYAEDIADLLVPSAAEGEDATKPVQVLVCGSFYLVGEVITLLEKYENGIRRDGQE